MRGSILKVIRIHLHEEDPNGETIIHIHAASRKNMTRAKEKEKHVVSPVAGQRPTIEKKVVY